MPLPPTFVSSIEAIVGSSHVRTDDESLIAYGTDALKRGHPADLVVVPGAAVEIAGVARLCHEHRVPLVVRGAGTGYTGGAVPLRGGVVLSVERLNRILEIDVENLLAVVEPNVVTGDLQDAVERVGLFYPPDPASLEQSSIGGNVAECAGGPRAFKYGTTKRYVLALEAVLPTGEIVRTGSKAVKNVVGYDLTQLLVGSEGTLAILTEITLRLVPAAPARATLRAATFADVRGAVAAVSALLARRVVPAAIELRRPVAACDTRRTSGVPSYPTPRGHLLLVEADGIPPPSRTRPIGWKRRAGTGGDRGAARRTDAERDELWQVRRQLSLALRATGLRKINHDVVVPRGRIPELFDAIDGIARDFDLRVAAFGHAGDGNIHVNLMVTPATPAAGLAPRRPSTGSSNAWSPSRDRSAASTASGSPRRPTSASSCHPTRSR
jgi:glycolate oxidase